MPQPLARRWTNLGSVVALLVLAVSLIGPVLGSPPPVLAAVGLTENFDSVVPPALPAGWEQAGTGGFQWQTINTASDTSPNAAYAPNTSVVSDLRLTSPAFTVGTSTQLTFRHRYQLEFGFDGGVLEISINNAAFLDVVAAGGSFALGEYTSTLSAGTGNPLGGRAAWTGSTAGAFQTSIVNLPPAAQGQTARLRWRLGNDQSFGGAGWIIDSIHLPAAAPATPTPCPGGYQFSVIASGPQVVGGSDSPATGFGTLVLDPATNVLSYHLTYQDLISTETGSHLHHAAVGSTGPVFVVLPLGTPKLGSATWDPANTAALLGGRVYWDVHTTEFGAGELRGQVALNSQCVSPTATASATASSTSTRTATPTPSATATSTATAAVSSTHTSTGTPAATVSPTATRSPTGTATSLLTQTAPPTLTSGLPTLTVAPTRTPTATASVVVPGAEAKVALCHATGSERNPYRYVEVSAQAAPVHLDHGGFVASSPADCERG